MPARSHDALQDLVYVGAVAAELLLNDVSQHLPSQLGQETREALSAESVWLGGCSFSCRQGCPGHGHTDSALHTYHDCFGKADFGCTLGSGAKTGIELGC